MIITIFRTSGMLPRVDFTTDWSWWYYMKPFIKDMWRVDTLGM